MEDDMTPRQYWTACRIHDWFYTYSDDPRAYRAGKDDRDRLLNLTHERPELAEIFEAWQENKFNAGPVPTEPKLED